MAKQFDLIIIGAGIIGLATGYRYLQQHPGSKLLILEKEPAPAQHQTGRNSGVVHAGVYYAPKSVKASFCRTGRQAIATFCAENQLPYEQRGKLLIATSQIELERMAQLEQRAQANGLIPEPLASHQVASLEPGITGLGALRIKESAITNYSLICHCLQQKIAELGGQVRFGFNVDHIEESSCVTVLSGAERYTSSQLIACAGIHSDRLIYSLGQTPEAHMLPFRGEYYRISRSAGLSLNHMIYPIPDPQLPFLGVHLTPMIDGTATAGPNAILALGKESYQRKLTNLVEGIRQLATPGALPFLLNHAKYAFQELGTSLMKALYLEQVQKYAPNLRREHLQAYPAGIRAQAITPEGELVDDFLFTKTERCLVVANAPSPAATSCFPIAEHIVETLQHR